VPAGALRALAKGQQHPQAKATVRAALSVARPRAKRGMARQDRAPTISTGRAHVIAYRCNAQTQNNPVSTAQSLVECVESRDDAALTQEQNMAKATKKKVTKDAKPGVIASVGEILEKAKSKGATSAEIVAALRKRFPGRDAEGMKKPSASRSTILPSARRATTSAGWSITPELFPG
jgi:hypothetical protein